MSRVVSVPGKIVARQRSDAAAEFPRASPGLLPLGTERVAGNTGAGTLRAGVAG